MREKDIYLLGNKTFLARRNLRVIRRGSEAIPQVRCPHRHPIRLTRVVYMTLHLRVLHLRRYYVAFSY